MITLVNANMSIKYSLTGHLSATDIITDGFYDVGKVFARGFHSSVLLKKSFIAFSHWPCFTSGACRRENPDIGGTGPAARQSAQAYHSYQHGIRVCFLTSSSPHIDPFSIAASPITVSLAKNQYNLTGFSLASTQAVCFICIHNVLSEGTLCLGCCSRSNSPCLHQSSRSSTFLPPRLTHSVPH